MTKLLAIDTSGEACSVALSLDGKILEHFEVIPRLHARKLLPMVQSLLAEADVSINALDAIAFGRGPGSFTGLRICAGVVQGLAFAADIPTLPVSSLAALAQGVYRTTAHTHILTVMDARMAELYWAGYQVVDGRVLLLGEEQLSSPEQLDESQAVLNSDRNWIGVGDGWKFSAQFPTHVVPMVTPLEQIFHVQAQDIVRLADYNFQQGLQVPAEQALPVYLRGKSAWRKVGE
ncbi:MAG: tRNA (adenosine(37)-N6)-threonylcarbamoyltransferase complex dimerization subunit type 1 TsaB [Pseudomonadales bacterium]